MKAYIAIKYHQDNKNRATIEDISAALEKNDVETVCIARDVECWGDVTFSPSDLMRRSFDEIDASDVVIVDLTEKGVGVGIEAGYAHAKGKRIVTIARQGADISETLLGISHKVMVYGCLDDLETWFASNLG